MRRNQLIKQVKVTYICSILLTDVTSFIPLKHICMTTCHLLEVGCGVFFLLDRLFLNFFQPIAQLDEGPLATQRSLIQENTERFPASRPDSSEVRAESAGASLTRALSPPRRARAALLSSASPWGGD